MYNTFVFLQPRHVWSLNLGVGSLEGLDKKQLWPFSQDLEAPSTPACVQTHVHTGTHNILPHSLFPALLRLLNLLSTNFYLPFPPIPQIQLIYRLLIHTTFWNFLFSWVNHVLILSLLVFLFFFLMVNLMCPSVLVLNANRTMCTPSYHSLLATHFQTLLKQ